MVQCSKEVHTGVLELLAGAFIVSAPALALADALDGRSRNGE
jgi:hypothetical protein